MAHRSLAEFFADVIGSELCLSIPREAAATAAAIETRTHDGATWDSLIASPSAASEPLRTQGDIARVRRLPHGYFLAGFWGHGINSYAFYWCHIAPGRRLHLRIPYGGVYSDTDRQRENLLHVLDACRRVLEAIERVGCDRFYLVDSMGRGDCEIVLSSGEQIRLRGSAFAWDRLLEALLIPRDHGPDDPADDPGDATRPDDSRAVDSARNPDLEAAVVANPDDPAPYLVYADWLQSQGHVHGELIALAFQQASDSLPVATDRDPGAETADVGTQARAELARAELDNRVTGRLDRLIASNRRALLGKLAHYSDLRATWYMGFLLGAHLRLASDADVIRRLLELPAARCLRELVIHSGHCGMDEILDALRHVPQPSLLHTVIIEETELAMSPIARADHPEAHDTVLRSLSRPRKLALPLFHRRRTAAWPVLRPPSTSAARSPADDGQPAGSGAVLSQCRFSSDGELLATLDVDGERIAIWHVATGHLLLDLALTGETRMPGAHLVGFAAGDRAVILGGAGSTVVVGVSSGAEWYRISRLRPIALSRDGTTLVGVRRHQGEDRFEIRQLARPRRPDRLGPMAGLLLSPVAGPIADQVAGQITDWGAVRGMLTGDGTRLAVIDGRHIHLWRAGDPAIHITGAGEDIRDLAFAASGDRVIFCSHDSVQLRDLGEQTDPGQDLFLGLPPGVDAFHRVGFLADNLAFAIADDRTVWLCRPDQDRWLDSREMTAASSGAIRALDRSPRAATVAVIRLDCDQVELHDLSQIVAEWR